MKRGHKEKIKDPVDFDLILCRKHIDAKRSRAKRLQRRRIRHKTKIKDKK